MARKTDKWLARLANRLDWARTQVDAETPRFATIDASVTLHPTARIDNILRNPEAMVIGAQTHIRGQLLTFWNGGKISIGKWCYVGEGTRIWSQSSISIGDYVLIAHLVDIHDTNSHPIDWRERRLDTEAILSGTYRTPTQTICAPVVIEDDVWIGYKASVMKGVRIGRGAIVSSNAVVTKDVAAWTIVAGNPAKVIGELTPEERTDFSHVMHE
ncbi:MAG TPA: DapH/DapD/GlmU-related protein [Pyrinomonadaceae bacterium]|nr:DapH/DapD/GlmU-related protein [Pyrinomonadaceae bacterium]